MAQSREASTVK